MIILDGFYKITSENLRSDIWKLLEDRYIQYTVDEWIKPKVGKIFVFPNLHEAKLFRPTSRPFKMFRCQIVNPTKLNRILFPDSFYKMNLEKFWNFGKGGMKINNYYWVVDAIKLIQEIKDVKT